MLSKYCKDIVDRFGLKIGNVKKLIPNLYDKSKYVDRFGLKIGNVKKLIPNLYDKSKYVAHYKNLKYYLSLGIKLKKIHITLSFKLSNWLKGYCDVNTEKRRLSNDEFNKELYKLMNNCIYGKSIENIRERINVKLITEFY